MLHRLYNFIPATQPPSTNKDCLGILSNGKYLVVFYDQTAGAWMHGDMGIPIDNVTEYALLPTKQPLPPAYDGVRPVLHDFDDIAWKLFFDVIGDRHPALDIPRVREEVQKLQSAVGFLTKDRDHERFHREAAEGENERLRVDLGELESRCDSSTNPSTGLLPLIKGDAPGDEK